MKGLGGVLKSNRDTEESQLEGSRLESSDCEGLRNSKFGGPSDREGGTEGPEVQEIVRDRGTVSPEVWACVASESAERS